MLHDEKQDLDEDGKIIWDVANYIDEHGWCQDVYGSLGTGAVCILGAYIALYNNEFHPSVKRIGSFLGADHNWFNSKVIDWNDEEGRTKEEVITMLKQAARSK